MYKLIILIFTSTKVIIALLMGAAIYGKLSRIGIIRESSFSGEKKNSLVTFSRPCLCLICVSEKPWFISVYFQMLIARAGKVNTIRTSRSNCSDRIAVL